MNHGIGAPVTLYGIKNCDQIKKARRWLETHHVEYHFHDYRTDAVPPLLADWLKAVGVKTLVNRQSSSWRALNAAQKSAVEAGDTSSNQAAILALLRTTPTLIKRPLLTQGATILVGFDEATWSTRINSRDA